jgi:hypothetical protein
MEPNDEDNDPYASTGSLLAHLYSQHGVGRIHAEMTTLVESGTIPRQFVELIAAELRAARLSKVAEIVESYASQCPDGLDVARFCNYCQPPHEDHPESNSANIQAWRKRQSRSMASLNARRDRWLRLANIGT